MKPNSDTETPVAASLPKSDVKTVSIWDDFEASHKSPFLWKNCKDKDQRDRVDIKQQAACDGLRYGETIANALRNLHNEKNEGIGIPEVMDWVKQFDTIRKNYQSYLGPIVGFLGVIGAGKTSLINALLGQEDLLASSCERAATAVLCDVVYNHEFSGYRAEVVYRTRQSLAEQLDKMFEDLSSKKELELRKETLEESQDDHDPNDSEMEEIREQLHEIDASISDVLKAVETVWGVYEDDLKDMSTQSLLDTKRYGAEYLGTTREVSETDQNAFAEEIRQCLASTSQDETDSVLPPWPLIEKVTIYTKADILKYGLRIRDLPGLNDTVEGRSKIARENSKDIDITVIVAPVTRGTDEKTAASLIGEQQQMIEMKMDGKFNRGSFCVVLSGTDNIKSEQYLRQAAKTDKFIENKLDRVKKLDTDFACVRSRKRKFQHQMPEHDSSVSGGSIQLDENRREAFAIKEWMAQSAISMRNRNTTERIQHQFQKRKQDIGLGQDAEFHSEAVEVFGISSNAYWMSKSLDDVKQRGFPDERYSGIPRFRQWLFESTFTHREQHLEKTLNKLLALFNVIQGWIDCGSKTAHEAMLVELEPEAVEKIHTRHRQGLTSLLKDRGGDICRLDPLKEKEAALTECQRQSVGIVESWAYRYPKNKKNHQLLHEKSQVCILRRQGEPYTSHPRNKDPHTYTWLDDLIEPFFKATNQSWTQVFQEMVPAYEKKIIDSTKAEWQKYGRALAHLSLKEPARSVEDLAPVGSAIESGQSNLVDGVREVLRHLTEKARVVHPVFRQEMKEAMIPVFEKATDITGLGCKLKREKVLRRFVKDHSISLFQKALKKLDAELSKLFQQHASDLEGLAASSVSEVELQLQSHFGSRKAAASPAAQNTRLQLQKENKHHLESWRACWETPPNPREDHVMRGDLSIPAPEFIEVKESAYVPVDGVRTDDDSKHGDRSDRL